MQQVFCIELILLFYLVFASIEDIKRKVIDLRILLVFVLISIVLLIVFGMSFFNMVRLLGSMPGLVLVAVSKVSRGAVGMGDAVVVLWVGYMMGIMSCLGVLTIAWMVCFVIAAICWLRRKKDKIPFIPFLCTGFYLHMWITWTSMQSVFAK